MSKRGRACILVAFHISNLFFSTLPTHDILETYSFFTEEGWVFGNEKRLLIYTEY